MIEDISDNISIVMSSCLNKPERKEYLLKSISSIRENMGEDIDILVGFDKYGMEIEGCNCCTHDKGMGYSFNWGIKNAKSDFVLQTEDDWLIEIGGNNSENLPNISSFIYHLNKRIAVVKNNSGIFKFTHLGDDHYKTGKFENECSEYKFLEWKRPEIFMLNTWEVFYYSNQPHLKRRNLHEEIGWYKEDVPPHEVEIDMCRKFYESKNRTFSCPFFTFVHIGNESARKD